MHVLFCPQSALLCWNAILLCLKMGYPVYEAWEFVYNCVIMPHTRVVLFTHSLILFKGYVIMLKSFGLYIMLLC